MYILHRRKNIIFLGGARSSSMSRYFRGEVLVLRIHTLQNKRYVESGNLLKNLYFDYIIDSYMYDSLTHSIV